MTDLSVGDTADFPVPVVGQEWPQPRGRWYPMKPSDRLQPDGQLFSGSLDRVKVEQHDGRYVIEWRGEQWRVVRLPLRRVEPGGGLSALAGDVSGNLTALEFAEPGFDDRVG